ncbi:mucus-binding protein, LPXTG-motif cell wall anchor [Secundilactobacillus pentosiphilus]|uniref:Mucus-binding protein, LPXTG-motif cell wall anchor n=1 Tax=Secundilactobacillus pentosiphilus TaxID=1714682 RepID=A0A1Z5IMD0_9LACO|nr:KxYKxGKxW signal peptide domain-containing protein [Secundilactobacillus pentosiphilus]GAX02915.1 mucus-binding protein, LPXTG-motif cell wall anchor [Secundilactobacillus pentosiphilus]
MVGKNNHIRTVRSNLKEHYKAYKAGTRWIYASIASLALGAGLLLGSTTTYADTESNTTQEPAESESTEVANKAVTSQKATTVPLKTAQSTAATTNADSASTNDGNTATKTADQSQATLNNAAKPADDITGSTSTNTETPVSNNQKTVTQQSNSTTKQLTAAQTPEKQTLVDPTDAQLDAAKASAAKTYATTHQAQEIDAVAGETDATAPLTISTNAVGYGTNATSPLTLTLTVNAKAGDVCKINIPTNTPVYTFDQAVPLNRNVGSTETTANDDGSHTVTDIFTTDSTTQQLIKINLNNNWTSQPAGMSDVGKTLTKTITYSINGVDQTPITFTQRIQPTTNLSTVSLLYPDAQTIGKILPNQNYVFGVSVNEADGIQDDTATVPRVNNAVNFGGSKITIPVPTGFVLDTSSTSQINGIVDGTTITQPGGKGTDVIVNVPAKAGNQVSDKDVFEYKIVGAFDVAQTAADQTLTANGDVTFSQVINSDGTTLTDSADPWSVTILAANTDATQGSKGTINLKGNSSVAPDKLELDQDPSDRPQYLNSFGFTFNSAAEAKNAKITITIPSGLDVTSIKTPAQGISPKSYMPDTSSWSYTFTLADGTTQTGSVSAGGEAKITGDSAIRTAVFTPNKLAPGSYATDLGTANSFIASGELSTKYDDGTAIKNGDQLTSSAEIAFDAIGATQTESLPTTQTIVDNVALAQGFLVTRNGSRDPGNPSAGTLQLRYNDPLGQTTNKIYEPTFYFVIPKVTTVASINSLGWYTDDPVSNPATTDPTGELLTQATGAKVSQFVADNGQTVVKIDYAGTGTTVDMGSVTGHWGAVTLANDPDALPGSYPYYIYIVSPTTKLLNTTKPTDLSFVENNANAYLLNGENGHGDWVIETAPSFFNSALAQGNQNTGAVQNGSSDKQGDEKLTFYDSIVYTPSNNGPAEHNASIAINLPTKGDSQGSGYTFNLTGPIQMPANYTTPTGDGTPINATVLYSTQPQAANTAVTTPDTTGYVNADQVTDWSTIRSIIIQVTSIKANTSTGRIPIVGTAANFKNQGNKTGYLQTIFYGDGANASVSSKEKEPSIKITGTSTVKARYHYVDGNGVNQYVELDDLSKALTDGVDTFTNDYPTKLSDFSSTDQGLIPAGYKLVTDDSGQVTPTIVDSKTDGKPVFGQVAQNSFDGDFVQYELAGHVSTQVEYIDDDNSGAIVGTPKVISGAPGGSIDWSMDQMPVGYQLAKNQVTSGTYNFKADSNMPVQIHLKHIITQGTATSTRTITYTGVISGNPASINQPANWTTSYDEVTKVTTYTPLNNYAAVDSPDISGYTPDKASVPAVTNTIITTKPGDSQITVTYVANSAELTVTYVDTDDNDKVVGDPETLNGTTDKTGTYTVTVPDNYILAAGQDGTVPYTFKAGTDTSDNLTIKLAHKHTTDLPDGFTGITHRTITYTGAPTNPSSVSQPLKWTTDTDEVTGVTTYTPSGNYPTVTSPSITGYTPDQATVAAGTDTATTTMPSDSSVTVTYSANDADLTVTYIDKDENNKVVGTPETLTGKVDETGTYTVVIPAGYVAFDANQPTSVNYTFKTDNSDNITISLKHAHTTKLPDGFTGTTTRTITYTGAPKNPDAVPQSVTWTTDTDEVTGVTTYTPSGDYEAVNTPNITGYVPDKTSVPVGDNAVTTTMPTDTDETVTYSAGDADLTVTYVDVDKGNATVGDPVTLSGKTDGTGTYTAVIPDGYVLAPGQDETVPYTFTTDTSDNLTIKLAHKHTTDLPDGFTGQTTRTVIYTGVTSGNPASVKQSLNWTTDTDLITKVTTYTPVGDYSAVITPEIAGYTPDKLSVLAGTDTTLTAPNKPADSTVIVTYTPNAQNTILEYVDDDNGGAVVGQPITISGATDGIVSWNTNNKPVHYTLAAGQPTSGTYTFTADNNLPIIIHLNHKLDFTTTTSTRTIHYVVDDPSYTDPVPAPTVQTITWKVVTDEVTGNSVATPQGAYYEQTVPNLPGYKANPIKVDQQAVGSVVARDVPMYNEDVVVTYTPIKSGQPTQQTQPGQPNQPLQPTQPIEPTQPTTPSTPDEGTVVNKTTTPGKGITETTNSGTATSRTTAKNGNGSQSSFDSESGAAGTLGKTSTAVQNDSVGNQSDSSIDQQNNQQKLPQTNEQNHSEVGLGLLGLLTSMLGLVGLKRRKRDDE